MKDLFIKTEDKIIPIEQNQIDKYNLTAGSVSPFTGNTIVNKDGKTEPDKKKEKDPLTITMDDMNDDGVFFTTSEIYDIADGVDSDIDVNL